MRFLHCIIFLLTSIIGLAQAPARIGYQAVVRDEANIPVKDEEIGVKIQLIQGVPPGTVVYEETVSPVSNQNGLISFEIGGGVPMTGAMETIVWSEGPYYIQIDMDPEGGSDYTITSTSQIISVPFAFYAETAEKLADGYTETQGLSDVLAINNSANSQIKNVTDPTDMQDVVTKSFLEKILFSAGLTPVNFSGSVRDTDYNVYPVVTIGTQQWMAENLRTTRLNDGTQIPLVIADADWTGLSTPGYCWYENVTSNSQIAGICGAIYNWYTIETRMICPAGWHVPTEQDFQILTETLGGWDLAGGKMKENGTRNWNIPNTGGSNESGFTALPAGGREFDGAFIGIANATMFWTDKNATETEGTWLILIFNSAAITGLSHDKRAGTSVRCIKD